MACPKDWTGRGELATDGGSEVFLFPPGGDSMKGPYITYYDEPECAGCIVDEAAKYFSQPRAYYDSTVNDDGKSPIEVPAGIKCTQVTSTIVTYTLPEKNGLTTRGVAYYMPGDEPHFSEAIFVLPAGSAVLQDFLLVYYIKHLQQINE